MAERPSPAQVRSVLARITKVHEWIDESDQTGPADCSSEEGPIGYDELDRNFREGLTLALRWVTGEYGRDGMPPGIADLVQHTNKRDFMRLLKELSEHY